MPDIWPLKQTTFMDNRNLILYFAFFLVGLSYVNQTIDLGLLSLADQAGRSVYTRISLASALGLALVCSPLILFRKLLAIALGLLLCLALLPIHIFLVSETFLTPLTPFKIVIDLLLTVGYYFCIIDSLILLFQARKMAVFQLPTNTIERLSSRLALALLPTLIFIIFLTIRLQ